MPVTHAVFCAFAALTIAQKSATTATQISKALYLKLKEEVMTDSQKNIYQTPSSDLDNSIKGGVSKFKRFSAWGVFGLSLITLGIYPLYWLYSRSKVLNSFHDNVISKVLLNIFILVAILSFSTSYLSSAMPTNTVFAIANGVLILPYLILYLTVLFKFRNRLREITGDVVGPVLTFFFSAIYLQYKINESIDSE